MSSRVDRSVGGSITVGSSFPRGFTITVDASDLDASAAASIDAFKAWADNSPSVSALLSIAEDYAPLFQAAGAVFSIVGAVYNIYASYQKDKADAERAQMIIREIVEQVGGMIDRAAKDIENHIDDGRLKDRLSAMESNRRSIQLWLETAADSDFADMQADIASRLILDSMANIAGLESFFNDAIATENAAKAAAVYKNLIDAYQMQNQILAIVDKTEPHTSNITAVQNINRLLIYHQQVIAVCGKTIDTQFSGPFAHYFPVGAEREPDGPMPHAGQPAIKVYVYSFRGEKRFVLGNQSLTTVRTRMEAHKESEFLHNTENIRPLEDEHRRAIAMIQQLE